MPIRRPLIGVALVVMLGTWLGNSWAPSRPELMAGFGLLLLLAVCSIESARRRTERRGDVFPRWPDNFAETFIFLAVFTGAWLAADLRINDPSKEKLAAMMSKPSEGIELIGGVIDDPAIWEHGEKGGGTCRFVLRAEKIRRITKWQEINEHVRMAIKIGPEDQAPRYGERWRFAGVLTDRFESSPASGRIRTTRSYQRYVFGGDIADAERLSGDHGFFLKDLIFRMRREAAGHLALGIEHRPDVVGMLRALLLGYRHEPSRSVMRDFRLAGIYHILAISGIHVAIFSVFIIAVMGAIGISRIYWIIVLAPCLLWFVMMTGMGPSTVRGAVMAILFFLGAFLYRQTDVPSALALAALIIIACDPAQLFDRGFILSFTVMAGLLVLSPPILARIGTMMEKDPFKLEPEPVASRLGRKLVRISLSCLVISTAAWLVAFPLIARWFNRLTLAAPLSSLIIAPLVPLVLLGGWFAVFFGGWFPLLAEIFNSANVVLVGLITACAGFAARIPASGFFVATPPVWSLGLWYFTLSALAMRRKTAGIFGALSLALALAVWMGISHGRIRVEVVNPDGNAVCFLHIPQAGILVNAGPAFKGSDLTAMLRRRGVNRLHALVLTRAEARHAGGAFELLRNIPVKELWCVSTNMRSVVFRNVIEEARSRGVEIRELAKGDSGRLRRGVEWSVIQPEKAGTYRSAEEAALVLLFRRRGNSIVVSGTSRRPTADGPEDDILSRKSDTLISLHCLGAEREWPERLLELSGMFKRSVICVSSDYPHRILDAGSDPIETGNERNVMILPPGGKIRFDFGRKAYHPLFLSSPKSARSPAR